MIFSCYPLGAECEFSVHKTFRRRHGRLLNVLCVFRLHPVYLRGRFGTLYTPAVELYVVIISHRLLLQKAPSFVSQWYEKHIDRLI